MTSPRRSYPAAFLAALTTLLVLLLSACGSSGGTDSAGSGSSPGATRSADPFPTTVQAANGTISVPARPQRIVSLSPTATEMLFAVGAGEQVVAVDDQSTHPTDAPRTKLSGFQPSAEAVIGYKPDLVVLSSDTGGIVAALTKVKVPTLLLQAAAKLDDSYDQLRTLGTATGHRDQGVEVAEGMEKELARIAADTPRPDRQLSYYHELDPTFFSATSSTFVGQVYALFGLRNIADTAPKASGGYPQLSAEYVVKAAPDLVFLADTKCCKQTAQAVAARPGWSSLPAVRDGGVVALDDDTASRWGPRVVDFARAVADAVKRPR